METSLAEKLESEKAAHEKAEQELLLRLRAAEEMATGLELLRLRAAEQELLLRLRAASSLANCFGFVPPVALLTGCLRTVCQLLGVPLKA